MLAGPSAGVSVSSRSRKRTTALNARSFASCSGKSRSIASAPTSPTPRRYDSSRASRCDRTSSAPVTVWSSPPPWCSRSSTWLSGSRRPPNRDFVLRTPFATAPIRPRSRVYRWSTRSASPRRKERSTTASVLYERPATWLKCRDGSGRESTRRFRVLDSYAQDSDVYDPLVRLLRPRQDAARRARPRIRGDLARRRPGFPPAPARLDRQLDRAADPDRRPADRRVHGALAARPRGRARAASRLREREGRG